MRRPIDSGWLAGALISASLLALELLWPAAAAGAAWRLARGPSKVEFAVGHLLVSEVHGRFRRFRGTVDCPGDDFTDARVDVVIEVASIYTGHADRDRHLAGDDFFAADRYPQMRFASRSVERTGPGTYRLVGDLTIRGRTRQVELETVYRGERRTPRGRRRDFHATGSINRSEFGLTWNTVWGERALVAEEVEITLRIALLEAS